MADAEDYRKLYDFSAGQQAEPLDSASGERLDDEFARVSRSFTSLNRALKDLRRSDGKLNNGIVTVDSLEPALKSLATQSAVQYFAEILAARDVTTAASAAAVAASLIAANRWFATPAELLASTVNAATWPVGTTLFVGPRRWAYEAVATGEWKTTAGGVKLLPRPDSDNTLFSEQFALAVHPNTVYAELQFAIHEARRQNAELNFMASQGRRYTWSTRTVYTDAGYYGWHDHDFEFTTVGDGDEITFNGALYTNRTLLTADVLGGSLTGAVNIPVGNATPFANGGWALLMSDQLYDTVDTKRGEFVEFTGINGSDIVLKTPIRSDYAVASAARIMICPWTTHVNLTGAKWTSPLNANRKHVMIRNCKVTGLDYESVNSGSEGVQMRGCDLRLMKAKVRGRGFYRNDPNSAGYPLNQGGNLRGEVVELIVDTVRHGVLGGNSGGPTLSGTVGDGLIPSRFFRWPDNCVITNCVAGPVDNHNGTYRTYAGGGTCTFADVTLTGEDAITIQGDCDIGVWHFHGGIKRSVVFYQLYGHSEAGLDIRMKLGRIQGSSEGTDGYGLAVTHNGPAGQKVFIDIEDVVTNAAGGLIATSTNGPITIRGRRGVFNHRDLDGFRMLGANDIDIQFDELVTNRPVGTVFTYSVYASAANHKSSFGKLTTINQAGSSHIRAEGPVVVERELSRTGGATLNHSITTSRFISRAPLRGFVTTTGLSVPAAVAGVPGVLSFNIPVTDIALLDIPVSFTTNVNYGGAFVRDMKCIAGNITLTVANPTAGAIALNGFWAATGSKGS